MGNAPSMSRGTSDVAAQAAQAASQAVLAVQAAAGLGAIAAARPSAVGLFPRDAQIRDDWVVISRDSPVSANVNSASASINQRNNQSVDVNSLGSSGSKRARNNGAGAAIGLGSGEITGLECVRLSAQMVRAVRAANLRGEDLRQTMENLNEAMALLTQKMSEIEHRSLAAMSDSQRTCCACDVAAEDTYADFVELANCGHSMCLDCFRTHVLASAPRASCIIPSCACLIAERDIRANLQAGDLDIYMSASLHNIGDQICHCPNCESRIALDRDKKDTRNAARVRCVCNATFCADCAVSPYHEGLSCEEFLTTTPCRFCENRVPAPSSESSSLGVVVRCASPSCEQKAQDLCGKIRPECGHVCGGLAGESSCPEMCFQCLGPDALCVVCLDPLEQGASIELSCGHPMHVECIRERFASERSAERATLTFAKCTVCKADMAHPEALEAEFLAVAELRASVGSVLEEARQRASPAEALLEDDAFTLFYCTRCRRPFFGGMRQCEEAVDDANHGEGGRHCSSCTCALQQVSICPEHGPDSMQFKCSFCCTPASFFCWGTTHFCVDCHARQMAGERLNKLSISQLPQCNSAEDCPLGLNHPPNGTPPSICAPVVLGCSMCQARHALM